MYKVIVERPRNWKSRGADADRRRHDFDGPRHLGMRAGYGRPALNENLNPLRRYLHSQVGRPWDKVYSEIANTIDRRNTVQQHVYQHLDNFVAVKVVRKAGRLVDLDAYSGVDEVSQQLYVDPRTGLLRINKSYRTWSQRSRARAREYEAKVHARCRIVDEATRLHLIDGEWYEVRYAPLPPMAVKDVVVRGRTVRKYVAESRFDVVLKRMRSRTTVDDSATFYAPGAVYASSKRQLSHREKKNYGLVSSKAR
jgi:hypothetical protein